MHGNALKLIYILIEEGFLKVNKGNFVTLRNIYFKETDQLTKKELLIFEKIINEADVDTTRSLTLIGDELAERGNNDLFTLYVLKKLSDSKLDVDILVSNHSAEFLRDYEKLKFSGDCLLYKGQGQSLANMHRLIERGLISDVEVRQMVQTTYQSLVKGISA